MFGLTSSCCTGSHVNSSLYLMSASDWESPLFQKKKKTLMKHSVGQSQHRENNREITRGGGKRERGERREERRGDGERNVSYSWMFHEWHTEDKSDWQQLCRRCTHSSPLGSLPLPVPPTLYHFLLLLSFTCLLRHPVSQTRNGCFTPLNKTKLNRGGLSFAGLVTHPSEVQ